MPIMFNSLLENAGIELNNVRLLRHKDQRAEKGRTPYELWRDDRPKFGAHPPPPTRCSPQHSVATRAVYSPGLGQRHPDEVMQAVGHAWRAVWVDERVGGWR